MTTIMKKSVLAIAAAAIIIFALILTTPVHAAYTRTQSTGTARTDTETVQVASLDDISDGYDAMDTDTEYLIAVPDLF